MYRNLIARYLIATAGMFLVAIGVALAIIPNLGVGALTAPQYVLILIWPRLTIGEFTIIVNCTYLLIQMAVLRRRFKARYLMQIVASVVFGLLTDVSIWMFSWLHVSTLAGRIALCTVACAVTAIGVSIEVAAEAWMLSAEMTVYAFTKTTGSAFGPTKMIMDSSLVAISMIFSWILFGNPFGGGCYTGILDILTARTDDIIIGIGTVMMALLPGWLMKYTDPLARKLLDRTDATGRWRQMQKEKTNE